jgi:hypothetical protein
MQAGDALETQRYDVTRADLVAYAGASGDHNPIHQDEAVATAVGLPGVIAHGMFTLALAARAVGTSTRGSAPGWRSGDGRSSSTPPNNWRRCPLCRTLPRVSPKPSEPLGFVSRQRS